MDKTDLSPLIHSPAQLSAQYVEFAERMKLGGKIIWDVPSIDNRITPMPPGFVGGIIGRPGHGKSTILAWLAKVNAKRIVAEGQGEKECVVFVTLDQSVEEIEAFFQCSPAGYSITDLAWGNVDIGKVRMESINRVKLPAWTVGRSLVRRGKYVRLTVDVMYEALREIERRKIHPRLILIDYVQIVPVAHARERQEQVTEAIVEAKELAEEMGSAMFIASQARRDVDNYDDAIPGEGDSMWASAFEHVVDRGFSIWRPSKRRGLESITTVSGQILPVTPHLFVMRNWKNRFADIGGDFYLHLDPSLVRLADLEREAEDIGPY